MISSIFPSSKDTGAQASLVIMYTLTVSNKKNSNEMKRLKEEKLTNVYREYEETILMDYRNLTE